MQYELYIRLERWGTEGIRPFCHLYVFNYDAATNTATGYYWDDIGSNVEQCAENVSSGPIRVGGRNILN